MIITISHKISRYDTIRSDSASPYVRTACCQLQTTAIYGRTYSSKQETAHNTGAPSFCLSTLSPLQVPGYWPTDETTVGGWPVSLKSRVIQQGNCEYWLQNNSSCRDSPQLLLFGGRTAWPFGGCTAGGRSHGSNI